MLTQLVPVNLVKSVDYAAENAALHLYRKKKKKRPNRIWRFVYFTTACIIAHLKVGIYSVLKVQLSQGQHYGSDICVITNTSDALHFKIIQTNDAIHNAVRTTIRRTFRCRQIRRCCHLSKARELTRLIPRRGTTARFSPRALI